MTAPLRLLLSLVVIVLASRVAFADDVATRAARRHFERGEKLFALGKFDDALDEYQKAYDAKPIPDFLFNIGQCHRNLGDNQAAVFSFKKFLQLEPDAPNRESVQALIDDLEAKIDRGDSKRFGFGRKGTDPPPPSEHPVYTKWWFWTGVAVVGVAGGVGIYAATRASDPPSTDLGHIVFGK